MTGSSPQHTGARKQRVRTTPAVAPVTRAIRAALAMSATMLVLSGPVLAADTCSYTAVARNSYVCDGRFVQTGHDAGLLPPIDLTRVRGEEAPVSVIPAVGAAGWAGDVSRPHLGSLGEEADASIAILEAGTVDDVTVIGGNGIDAASAAQLFSVANSNDISVSGSDWQYGIRENDFYYDVTVVNSGDLDVDSSGVGGPYSPGNHAFGIRASSFYGNVDVTNIGAISARASNDPDSGYSYARGIVSLSYYGDASITNAGAIDVAADGEDWALAFGIYNIASGFHESTVDNSASITASATTDGSGNYQWAWAAGVRATAIYPAYGAVAGYDDVLLHNSGDITASASVEGHDGNAVAWGAYTMSLNPGGTSTLVNDGTISSYAHAGVADSSYSYAAGIIAANRHGSSVAVNNGYVDAVARNDAADGAAQAIGIKSIYLSIGYGDSSIINDGDVEAHASGYGGRALSTGLSTGGSYSGRTSTIDNSGRVISTADIDTAGIAFATGISGSSSYGADVLNSGYVTADATVVDGRAFATGVYGKSDSGGYTTITNLGDIDANAVVTGSDAYNLSHATGIRASGYDAASVNNAGLIDASTIANTGDVTAYGAVSSSYHFAYLTNAADGIIDVSASTLDGNALAVGALVAGYDVATLNNYGDISALATSADGNAQAYAAVVNGTNVGIGLLINGGDLNAEASTGTGGTAYATGAYVYGNVASVFNDAHSSATATAGAGGTATARGARVYGMYTAVSNYDALTASATADGGTAMAKGAESIGYFGSSVDNAADILAVANADGGVATAMGSYSLGFIFSSYTNNTGTIVADASGASADALGVLNAALYLGDAITTNDGDIHAIAEGTVAPYGEEEAVAIGVYNFAMYYDSAVDNRGSIFASAEATEDIFGTYGFLQAKAIGVQALAAYGYGETSIVNTGDINAAALTSQGYASAWGAVAQSGAYGSAAIENDRLITSYAHSEIGIGTAIGAYALTVAGTSQLINHGDIVATADAERGIVNVTIDYADATGVRVLSIPYGAGETIVDNYGNIQAHARIYGGFGYATGVEAYSQNTSIHNATDANILATVNAELFGAAFAMGIEAGGTYSVDVANDGAITAYAHANAYSDANYGFLGTTAATGVYANASYKGDAMVVNNGDINAIALSENSVGWAQGMAGATGVNAYAKYDATIVNAGDINAIAESEFGIVGAYGAVARGKYSSNIINQAGSSIVASATVGSLAGDQSSGRAVSFGTQIFKRGMEDAVTYNAGSIVSHAVVTPDGTGVPIGSIATAFGSSIGYNSAVIRGEVTNVGSIEALASADFGYASAYGAFVATDREALITNDGDIQTGASATGGNAFAVGTYAYALHRTVSYNCDAYGCDWANPIVVIDDGRSLIENTNQITVAAAAQGGVGYSYGAVALGALNADVSNSGRISAVTDAEDALAIGVLANSFYGSAGLQNDGDIIAIADGDIANAYGAQILGAYGDLSNGYLAATLTNSGRILARADGTTVTATGVQVTGRNGDGIRIDNTGTIMAAAYGADATATAIAMDSYGSNTLTNTGTIAAFGDGMRIAIASGSGAIANISNGGSITGAILTGGLDDSFDNTAGATWHVVGDSDLGNGDDRIVNNGAIFLDNAAIRLGGYVNGNTFDNFGLIGVSGSNVLDMDNPFPVSNNGTISFVDGAPDDTLTIVGDFAGDGAINLDVSTLNLASDRLYIDGSVIEPTTQTINVNLTGAINAPSTAIPLVSVSGSSTASDFVLGNVGYGANGFLTLGFNLESSIDASNARDDVFSLGVDVTGLNDAGSLAAAIAPGAQRLVDAQVGTWRQRMGVLPTTSDTVAAPWLRMFASSGDVDAKHDSNFGAGGVFGFHQSNHGWEFGLDFRASEHLAIGVLFGKSDGNQSLDGGGNDRLDGTAFGVYATWLSANGFYVDLSQRRVDVDARPRMSNAAVPSDAKADAFNIEAGFTAWKLAGVNVVPQLQYTRTRIDELDPVQDGASTFVSDGGVSSRGRLGVAFDKSFQASGFTLTPYGSLNVVREFDGEYDYSVNSGLLGSTRTDGTSSMLELGLGVRKGGLSLSGGMNWTDGGAQQGVMGGQVVVRYGW
ncbi:autotransporter outer membrane beta-barrel domain-containing protein [Lysobacter tyrosinilyticus]